MFGRNPKRPPEKGDGSHLAVQDIFPTFQGEGPNAGCASVFIRLGGCNLACAFCDTEFESFTEMTLEDVLARVDALRPEVAMPLAVITGGEPLRQPIAPLCDALLARGFRVQLETNGTLWRPLDGRVEVICSPKAGADGYGLLRADVLERATALKFLISATLAPYTQVPDVGQGGVFVPVYLQPMDAYDADENARNLAHTLALARSGGYRLSLQLHKYIGVA